MKATNLDEFAKVVGIGPLGLDDDRYQDLSAGRGGSNQLGWMRECLKAYDAGADHFAKVAFTGHRGCGKTTELYRLERDVSDRFTPLHLTADEALLGDYDYTDLFLWLVDEVVKKFEMDETPLDHGLAEDVANWFALVTKVETDTVDSEISVGADAEAGIKTGWFGLKFSVLSKLKSMVKGNTKRRKEIRETLKNKSSELIARVNLLLDNAHKVLKDHGKPANLLIVVDNLDRLKPEVSGPLFFENGEFLKRPRAHMLYTVPMASSLQAGMNIDMVFDRKFTLSIVKVHGRDNRPNNKGINALVSALAQRADLDAVFAKRADARELVKMSGGSVRDLMRLAGDAQIIAATDGKTRIDSASVKEAVKKGRITYEEILFPSATFYPILAQIYRSKSDPSHGPSTTDPEKVEHYRKFFSDLLFNASVLAYNGESTWYDVHPLVQQVESFKKALANAEAAS
jgi:hypothetical protein